MNMPKSRHTSQNSIAAGTGMNFGYVTENGVNSNILVLQAVAFFYFLYFPKIRYTGNHLENEISAACGSSDREVLPICSVYGEKYGKIIIY